MKALKCDICGGYFDYNKSKISAFAFLDVNYSVIGDCTDICPECYLAIKKTINDRIKGGSKNARTENG